MGVNIGGIFNECYTLKSRVNKEIGLIVIDYLQLIETKEITGIMKFQLSHEDVRDLQRSLTVLL